MSKPIFVTQPYLPPLEEFIPYLQQIWEKKILTNNGPMHQLLEQALADYLGVPFVVLFNNGMNALLTMLQALEIKGEVITTPYSFVATSHAIVWNNLTPVFVDVEPNTLNIDPAKIEAAITDKTAAILPVHCYGNPCAADAIQTIADKYNLKVVYDAAHAFAVKDQGGSILRYGDMSILSFHATKVFGTFEGGAIICHSEEMRDKLVTLKNFGISSETTVDYVGINGKMSEVNAAFGLVQLKHIDKAIHLRANIDEKYRNALKNVKGIKVLPTAGQTQHNYAYFPILITEEYPLTRDEIYQILKEHNIFARRYFYPLISHFKDYKHLISAKDDNLPVANIAAQQVVCLPMYSDLDDQAVSSIIKIIVSQ